MVKDRVKTLAVFGGNEDIPPALKSHLDNGWEVQDLKRYKGTLRMVKVTLTRQVNYR